MVWGIFKKNKKDPRANYDFTDEDREISAKIKGLDAQIRRKKQELKIAEKKLELDRTAFEIDQAREELNAEMSDFYDEGDDTPEDNGNPVDAMVMALVTKMMGGDALKSSPTAESVTNHQPSPVISKSPPISLSDDEIREQISKIPKSYIKMAKSMDEKTFKAFVQKAADFDDDTISRALQIIKK